MKRYGNLHGNSGIAAYEEEMISSGSGSRVVASICKLTTVQARMTLKR